MIADDTFEISLLIGADFSWQIVGDQTVRGDGPTAVSSSIGYLLSGTIPASTSVKTSHDMDVIAANVSDTLDIGRLWSEESTSISVDNSKDTDAATDACHYQEHGISFSDGRCTAKSKRKHDYQPLPIKKKRTQHVIPRAESRSLMTCEPIRKSSITSAVATTLLHNPENTSTYTHEGITGLHRLDPGSNRKDGLTRAHTYAHQEGSPPDLS